jgi:hypothetical protein
MTANHGKAGRVTKMYDLLGKCAEAIFDLDDKLVGWWYKDGIFDASKRQVAWDKGGSFVDRRGYWADANTSLWRLIPQAGRRVSDAFHRVGPRPADDYD